MTKANSSGVARQSSLPRTGYILLAAISLFWGANWPGMKIALAEIPVWWFRAMCVGAGGIALLGVAWLSGLPLRVKEAEIPRLLLVSVFSMVGWQVFSAYGVSFMPAGRASIIAFTMPVWATILGHWLIDEPITPTKIAGLLLGLLGLAVLMGDDLFVFGKAPLGAIFMLGAALSWAIGTVLYKKYTWSTPVSTLVGWQLAVATVPITIGALLLEPAPHLTQLSWPAIAALVYVVVLPMTFCQWAYVKVVSLFPATIAAMGTLAVPIVGVYSSALLLGEPAGVREFASLLLICAALAVVLIVPPPQRMGKV